MSNNPIFSVIIPMYNVGKYIDECITSVLNQSFNNFEIICVNDGCTDNTLERLETYNDHRIKIITQENQGLSAARNTGINNSKGLFLAFLDSDDFWHKDKLHMHFNHLSTNSEIGVSYSASAFVDENSLSLGIGQHPKITNIRSQDILCRNPIGNGSAPVIRRTALNDIAEYYVINNKVRNCYFDENMRQSEDIECWIRISLNTPWKFEGIKDQLTYYRINSSGLSANLENQFYSWLYAMKKNSSKHSLFFNQWLPLAKSYQFRYLSRRAIQSGNHKDAIKYIHKSLKEDVRVIKHEPIKTITTLLCAYLSALPCNFYSRLQNLLLKKVLAYKAI